MKHSKSLVFIMTLLLVIGVFTPSVYAVEGYETPEDAVSKFTESLFENTSFYDDISDSNFNYILLLREIRSESGGSDYKAYFTLNKILKSDSFYIASSGGLNSTSSFERYTYVLTHSGSTGLFKSSSFSTISGFAGGFASNYTLINHGGDTKRLTAGTVSTVLSNLSDFDLSLIYSTSPIYTDDSLSDVFLDPISSEPVGEYPFDYADVRVFNPNNSLKPISSYNLPFKYEITFRNITEDFIFEDYQTALLINDWMYDINNPYTEQTDEHGYFYLTSTDIYTVDNPLGGKDMIVFAEGSVNHYLSTLNPMYGEGSHEFKIKLYKKIEGETSEVITQGTASFEVVKGFVDSNQDGLDDRTGQTYEEFVKGVKDPDYGPPIIDIGLDLSDFSIKDMSGFLEESLSALKGIFVNVWGIVPPELLSVILVAVVMYMILRVLGR